MCIICKHSPACPSWHVLVGPVRVGIFVLTRLAIVVHNNASRKLTQMCASEASYSDACLLCNVKFRLMN